VLIHFRVKSSVVFDFPDKKPGPFKRNPGQFVEEWKNFPDAFWPIAVGKKLQDPEKGDPVVLGCGGTWSVVPKNKRQEIALARKRARSVCCYVANYLLYHDIKNFRLKVGALLAPGLWRWGIVFLVCASNDVFVMKLV